MGGIVVQSAPKGKEAKTSLFCVTTLTPTDKYMTAIMKKQEEKKVGVFACADHAIWGWKANSKHGMSKQFWKTVAETDFYLFLDVWKHVKEDGRYKAHDFTVKVDPATVFIPSRLQHHLKKLSTQENDSVYLKICKPGGKVPSFSASLMVFSKMAMVDYYWSERYCTEHADHKYGEGAWWENCFDAIGITHMVDTHLLKDKVDGPSGCESKSRVAFHPLSNADDWVECHDTASSAPDDGDEPDFLTK